MSQAWIRYLENNFVGVANASRKCSDFFTFCARLASQCCLLFKGTPCCFFMAIIVSTKTMTSLRLPANFKLHIFRIKSLQINRVKFSRKSYPRVGMAFVLNNPLYNLKISDYFWRNSMINLDKGRFPYWKYCKKSLIFNVKSLHPILIYFTWNLAGMID